MGLKTKNILGIDVTTSSEEEILEEVRKCFVKGNRQQAIGNSKNGKTFVIFTPNPEIIVYSLKDPIFRQIVNTVQINIPDGSGVVWAIKKIYKTEIPKLSGVDMMAKLVKLAETESLRIGLIGGRGDLADKVAECLRLNHPKLKTEVLQAPELKVASSKYQVAREKEKLHTTYYLLHSTEEKQDDKTKKYFENLVGDIVRKKIDILFVALGFPKQEYFIDLIRQQLVISNYQLPIVLMSVGGSFDYISGRIPRAPLMMRNLGLEWLFRLILQPRRLSRQMKGAEFFLRIAFSSFFPIQ